eukprot:9753708-Lingulodinium_polyedra.AAC.1
MFGTRVEFMCGFAVRSRGRAAQARARVCAATCSNCARRAFLFVLHGCASARQRQTCVPRSRPLFVARAWLLRLALQRIPASWQRRC